MLPQLLHDTPESECSCIQCLMTLQELLLVSLRQLPNDQFCRMADLLTEKLLSPDSLELTEECSLRRQWIEELTYPETRAASRY